MGNKKTKIIIFTVVGILLIFLGITFSVVSLLNRESKEIQKAQEDVKNKYRDFKTEADQFTEARKKYQNVVSNNLYVESVEEEYETWIQALEAYQKVVGKVVSKAKPVGDVCIGRSYPDQNVMANCEAYMINYETVMNYFVKDVESFNKFLEEYYTDYKGDKEKYPTYELKEEYHYIDVNDDGKFIGKE